MSISSQPYHVVKEGLAIHDDRGFGKECTIARWWVLPSLRARDPRRDALVVPQPHLRNGNQVSTTEGAAVALSLSDTTINALILAMDTTNMKLAAKDASGSASLLLTVIRVGFQLGSA
jgi:hypothetical protein